MELGDLLKSALGAVIGFTLAQIVSVGSFLRTWYLRALLEIDVGTNNATLLSHGMSSEHGEMYTEEIYGFRVRNVGRQIALNVRFQLLSFDYRDGSDDDFSPISNDTYELAVDPGDRCKPPSGSQTLVPKASTTVRLATWTDGQYDLLVPAIGRLPPYFEECCEASYEGRFLVAAFADNAECVTAEITIRAGGRPERRARVTLHHDAESE